MHERKGEESKVSSSAWLGEVKWAGTGIRPGAGPRTRQKLRSDRTDVSTLIDRTEEKKPADAVFYQWVQDIRSELVLVKGRTEEEKQHYNETLNRAILGYEEDRGKILAMIHDLVTKRRLSDLPPGANSYATLPEAIFAEIIGLNVLELVLKHKEGLEEIQVVGRRIFEVRSGTPVPSPYLLPTLKDLERIQQNLVLFNNDTLNPRKRWAEVVLRDGSRVTMTGFGFTAEPTLTIRFYTVKRFDLASLASSELATLDTQMKDLILSLIRSYFNMVVIGPTNSGKTNLIKAIIAEMDDNERIITIESRFELNLKRNFPLKNIIEYEIDESDPRHSGLQAFKLALRQSPKRICHAEIRDEDANLYVRACTRGHEGSITSVHVNELEDVPDAITDMCMLDGRGMNPARLTKRITEYVTQIGIEMAIVRGKRKIVRIGEYNYENEEVRVTDLALYDIFTDQWTFPGKLSHHASQKIIKHDPGGFNMLMKLDFIEKEGE
ncbi:Flp pilus assembly complex ATPase component [Paenibacillus sp. SYP-B3998]|uniref:Flp pilus assembly complex ATPase component n=2 Tax=Paenibacillus sp. SYP-B3998 TaxID=2678564 RepID=A0A6G4A5E3_9BACL|nr:ATPase, T2SS/T4P/T4SS family [Paenibacillus sp. SYP-B3998]NEW09164.1 Flp pilus assembly complex ATPase component [Paenibacillus sp. SYP-B3998]